MSVVSRRWDLSSLFPGGTILPPELRTPRARDGYRSPPARGLILRVSWTQAEYRPAQEASPGWYPYSEGRGPFSGPVTTYIVIPGRQYRPLWEICSNGISSCPGKYIVLLGKLYRPPRERITSALGRYIVLSGKEYRPPQESLSSRPGNSYTVLPANLLFCGRA
jgi:hypothetical protein